MGCGNGGAEKRAWNFPWGMKLSEISLTDADGTSLLQRSLNQSESRVQCRNQHIYKIRQIYKISIINYQHILIRSTGGSQFGGLSFEKRPSGTEGAG